MRVSVIWPDSSDPARAHNDDSVVLRLEDGKDSFLLTGDIERPVERGILTDGDALGADFLKVPHHGAKTSSTQPFLATVHPAIAAISVGEANPFGDSEPGGCAANTIGRDAPVSNRSGRRRNRQHRWAIA